MRPWPAIVLMVSPCPLVANSAAVETVPVTSALMPIVVPCASFVVAANNAFSSSPRLSAPAAMARKKPIEKSCGVLDALPEAIEPSGATITASVKVPPMSTPTQYPAPFPPSDSTIELSPPSRLAVVGRLRRPPPDPGAHVDIELSDEQLIFQRMIRDFVATHIRPVAREWEHEGRYPDEIVEVMKVI